MCTNQEYDLSYVNLTGNTESMCTNIIEIKIIFVNIYRNTEIMCTNISRNTEIMSTNITRNTIYIICKHN